MSSTSGRTWAKRLGWCALVLFIFALIAHWEWSRIVFSRLQATFAAMRAAGEPMSMADLTFDATPDADNAALTYRRAAAALVMTSSSWRRYDDAQAADAYRSPLTADERADIEQIVKENRSALEIITGARGQADGDWHDHWTSPYLMASLSMDYKGERQLANLLRLDAEGDHARGDDAVALQRVHDLVRLSAAAERRCGLVAHLVAVGIRAMACEEAYRLAPQLSLAKGTAARTEAESLRDALLDERVLDAGRRREWAAERIMEADTFGQIVDGRFNKGASAAPGVVKLPLVLYLARPILISDMTAAMKTMGEIQQADTSPDWPEAHAAMPTWLRKEAEERPWAHLLSYTLQPSLDKAMLVNYRLMADGRLAAMALAIRMYAADHGNALPPSLGALVPDYLQTIPADPMAAGGTTPMRMGRGAPPRIYSVGENGVDDGGVEPLDHGPIAARSAHSDTVVRLDTPPREPADQP